ncbi:MAG: GAF domain-containing protein, partial [Cyanobacteria bacterium P01_F01_bin.153]
QSQYWEKMRLQSAKVAEVEALRKLAERQSLVGRTVDKIRQSLDLDTVFQTTTRELRHLLQLDRVAIYRFNPDWSGQFVAESFSETWSPLVNVQGVIADTHLQETQGGRYRYLSSFAVDDIYQAGHQACHVELLEQFQARAYAIVPIFQGQNLWGLLAGYQNSGPRQWQQETIDLMGQIGAQLGIALQQSELLAATQNKTQELTQTLNELRSTQLQLIQGEKMSSLGQLVAGIAHEINNPITFIHANMSHVEEYLSDLLTIVQQCQKDRNRLPDSIVQLMDDCDLDFVEKDLPKTLDSIANGSDRIHKLVSSLRTFSRLDESEVKAVDLAAGLDSTLVILQSRLKANDERPAIDIIKQYGDIPTIECYAAQLNQVFLNVIANAIDALEENRVSEPYIEIGMTADSHDVTVTIANNGPAIAEDTQSRLFDPFFTTKEPGKGTGLGLSISYQIVVDRHRGQLRCESVPGKTTFHIVIPIDRSAAEAAGQSTKSSGSVPQMDRQDDVKTTIAQAGETAQPLSV